SGETGCFPTGCVTVGEGGPALKANIEPVAIAIDGSDNLFIAEDYPGCIRRVDAQTGIIKTVAGTCSREIIRKCDFPLEDDCLSFPSDVALDEKGNLFIADYGNRGVRTVDAITGELSTVTGNPDGD